MDDARARPGPKDTPSTLESYRRALATLNRCPGALARIAGVFFLGQVPTHLLPVVDAGAQSASGLGLVFYHMIVMGPLSFGLAYALLVASRNYDPFVSDLFLPFLKRWGASIGAFLLTIAAMTASAFPALGAMLLIATRESPSAFLLAVALACSWLPILAAIRLSFTPYLLLEGGRAPAAALGESWERTQPAQAPILGVQAVAFGLNLPGMLVSFAWSPTAGGLAMLPGAILGGLAFASLYAGCVPEEGRGEGGEEKSGGVVTDADGDQTGSANP